MSHPRAQRSLTDVQYKENGDHKQGAVIVLVLVTLNT